MTTTERDSAHGGYEAEGGMSPMTKHEELERLARAATPGPWVWEHGELFNPEIREQHRRVIGSEPYEGQWIDDEGPDAAFIAAANPATVLALLSANREMREALRPFSALADMVGESWTDETPAFVGADGVTITIGQLRKARSALTTQRGDGE